MSQKKFEADLWIVVKPAVDLPKTWVSHCLTLDLMSQGSSAEHALEMIYEVIKIAVVDDLVAGRDPSARGAKTPVEDWAEQSRIVQRGTRFELTDLKTKPSGSKVRWAVNTKFLLEVHQVAAKKKSSAVQQQLLQMEKMPPAWKIAASGFRASHAVR